MQSDARVRLIALAESSGFRLGEPYCSQAEMREGVRQVERLAAGATLTGSQRLALLENLRLVVLRTAAAPNPRQPLTAQSRLRRWEHLRAAAPHAADAYVAVLGLFEIEAPECLLAERP
jgi:hypothetical protein